METKNKKNGYASESEYKSAMEEILRLMNKGETNLTPVEKEQLRTMAEAAEIYEDIHYPLPASTTLAETIERKPVRRNRKTKVV